MNKLKNILDNSFLQREASKNDKGYKLLLELLMFVAVYSIAVLIQFIVLIPASIYYMIKSDIFQEAMKNDRSALINDSELLNEITSSFPAGYTIIMLISDIAIIAAVIFYCRKVEQRSFRSMGFTKKLWGAEYITGYLAGFVAFASVISIGILTGSMEFSTPKSGSLITIILFLVGYLVQGMAEEVLCRGYLMVSISRKSGILKGILINSIVFACLHLFNPGITVLAFVNLFMFGVIASIYMIKRNNIWGVGAFHAAWNFVQGNVFGVQVSGMEMKDSIFCVKQIPGKSYMNGGTFGAEGGLAVTIVFLLIIVILCLMKSNIIEKENIN